jgi:hypothetical protein
MQRQFIHQSDLAGTGGKLEGIRRPSNAGAAADCCCRTHSLLPRVRQLAALGRKVLVVDVFDDVPRFELLRHGKL